MHHTPKSNFTKPPKSNMPKNDSFNNRNQKNAIPKEKKVKKDK
jgi:hypothetical protein